MAVIAIGVTALGSRYEPWRPMPVAVKATRCVALLADAADHQPKCATAVALAQGAEPQPADAVITGRN